MKFLTERTEIAKAINFNKYPVLRINMENDKGYGSNFAVGDKARVKYNCNGKIYYYNLATQTKRDPNSKAPKKDKINYKAGLLGMHSY